MKLLCSESRFDICEDIANKLKASSIDSEIKQRNPSLFESEAVKPQNDLYEIWIVNEEDFDKANSLLYPPEDVDPQTNEEKD